MQLLLVLICLAALRATSSNPSCPPGAFETSEGDEFCCPAACGACGGENCHLLPGGAHDCCRSQIHLSCESGHLPCKLSAPPSVCPAGGITDATKTFCCDAACGQCGGDKCHLFPLTGPGPALGDKTCCRAQITLGCDNGVLPCTFRPELLPFHETPEQPDQASQPPAELPTDEPTAVPTDRPHEPSAPDGLCADGILATGPEAAMQAIGYPANWYNAAAYCKVTVCCPRSCAKCDVENTCGPDVPDECCAVKIASGMRSGPYGAEKRTDVDMSCKTKSPPCVMPVQNDPCTNNPCKNGARCGTEYSSNNGASFGGAAEQVTCKYQSLCECAEAGNYAGASCGIDCKEQDPCGYGISYGNTALQPSTRCCAEGTECLQQNGKYGSGSGCEPVDRPGSCDECSKEGTKEKEPGVSEPCFNSNFYGPEPVYVCPCKPGYFGTRCETLAQPCASGTEPCGRTSTYTVDGDVLTPDNTCCTAEQACTQISGESGITYKCLFDENKPTSCDPDPCNGNGTCAPVNPYIFEPELYCECNSGFSGPRCNIKL